MKPKSQMVFISLCLANNLIGTQCQCICFLGKLFVEINFTCSSWVFCGPYRKVISTADKYFCLSRCPLLSKLRACF